MTQKTRQTWFPNYKSAYIYIKKAKLNLKNGVYQALHLFKLFQTNNNSNI
jgi:hypothetical protein